MLALLVEVSSDASAQAVTVTAGVLFIAALVAAWRVSLIAATIIIAIVVGLGGWLLLWYLASSVFVVGGMFIMQMLKGTLAGRLIRKWVLRLFEAALRQVEDEPLCLPCPLLALRAPRDEAGLVIGLGQVAQGLPNAAAWLFETAPWWLKLHKVVWLALALAFGLVVLAAVLVRVAIGPMEVPDWISAIWVVIFYVFFVGVLLSSVPLAAVLLVVLLLAVLAAMGIGLTTGREAFMLPAATLVEAEPLPNARTPNGLRRAEMELEILYEARLKGLNHSLYDAPEVRERIAIWLRDWARGGNAARAPGA